jgi:hypothetical protein
MNELGIMIARPPHLYERTTALTSGVVGGVFFFGLWAFMMLIVWLLPRR